MDNSVETVNAAATAIASAETRVQQNTIEQRRRWLCFGGYWCFKSCRQSKRIRRAVLVPEPLAPRSNAPASETSNTDLTLVLPFIAPPSSPASFLQSEPDSASLSPTGPLSFSLLSANSYSPTDNPSMFSVGPYAHEAQLVSPPAFSTFTTEPSTASFTPPPEPLHLTTTPSSPEVPFARLLTSSLSSSSRKSEPYEFNTYQFYPGSPIGNLVSPSSASGTTSPFPDLELSKTPPRRSYNEVESGSKREVRLRGVSFELSAEEVASCMAKKPPMTDDDNEAVDSGRIMYVDETYHDLPEKNKCASTKEFKFDNSDGAIEGTLVGSDWWTANEKAEAATAAVAGSSTEWTFFPMIKHGVS